ncbi:MAG TPA: sensor domain-containing diguanylate cyclase [Lysobacter sp.]
MQYQEKLESLVEAVQQLSLARDLESVAAIVRGAARSLADSDGASLVLRDAGQCYYYDEDAISPLWKGQRFPLSQCISGWCMLNRTAVAIEDIYADDRIPHAAYRPTFVRSLLMTPIRTIEPIGAIGSYWAQHHTPSANETHLLQTLANATSVALENIQMHADLEQRVLDRTEELAQTNRLLREEMAERERAEREVRLLSLTDELTGVHNRRGFQLLATQELEVARRLHQPCRLIFIDLDGLKQVNDRHGHAAGDAMIRQAAELLRVVFTEADVLARWGGDEFAVLALDALDAATVHRRVDAGLKQLAARHANQPYALSLSVGVVDPADTANASLAELLVQADAAMYVIKSTRSTARLPA